MGRPGSQVFVSYAHADMDYVTRLVVHLTRHGVEVWRDDEIPTGRRWRQVLREKVDTSAAVVLVVSPAANRSRWVRKEFRRARRRSIPIYPILYRDALPRWLADTQVELVTDATMPTPGFVDQLRGLTPQRRVLRHQIGTVPDPADGFQHRPIANTVTNAFATGQTAILTGARILSGLGGVGKTQLAAAIARHHRDSGDLDILIWATGADRTAILTTYTQAATDILGVDPADPDTAAEALLAHLAATTSRWLIVLDDVTDPDHLTGLWPPDTATGHTIVTTRRTDAALQAHGTLIPVDLYTPAEAHQYLASKFATRPNRLVEADQLADDLAYLPLALAQAAAYITDRDLTCAQYRQRFAGQQRTLIQLAPDRLPDDYTRPLAVTLALAIDAADALPPPGLAQPLLILLALLDPNGIPSAITTTPTVVKYLSTIWAVSNPVTADEAQDALAALTRLNLATSASGLIRVHGLVQRTTRERTHNHDINAAARAAADALLELWPDVEPGPEYAQTMRANTAALRGHAETQLWESLSHRLLFRTGRSLDNAGLVAAATAHWVGLTHDAQQRLGPDHPDTLASRNNLAGAYRSAGQVDRAIALFEATLADRQRVLGPDHPDTLTSRDNLAYANLSAGQLDRAIPLFEATLADRQRVLGPVHPHTLASRNNLAGAYWSAGQLDRAILLFEATLADMQRVRGPDHPHTLTSRNNLARAYQSAGQLDRAIPLFEATLTDTQRVLGPDHPDTLTSRNNLADAYQSAGQLDRAIPLFEATLADRQRVLGPDHPDTLTSRNNLAGAYQSAGQLDRAMPLN